jgi:CheY-like chemotaxis protein
LVAEDNPLNQQVLSLLLDPYHVDLSFGQNGEQAYLAAGGEAFDVVFMDLEMPGMGGLAAIKAIRMAEQEARGDRLPIICISAQASAEKIAAAHEAGADEYLSKPLKLEDLVAALVRVLESTSSKT